MQEYDQKPNTKGDPDVPTFVINVLFFVLKFVLKCLI